MTRPRTDLLSAPLLLLLNVIFIISAYSSHYQLTHSPLLHYLLTQIQITKRKCQQGHSSCVGSQTSRRAKGMSKLTGQGNRDGFAHVTPWQGLQGEEQGRCALVTSRTFLSALTHPVSSPGEIWSTFKFPKKLPKWFVSKINSSRVKKETGRWSVDWGSGKLRTLCTDRRCPKMQAWGKISSKSFLC